MLLGNSYLLFFPHCSKSVEGWYEEVGYDFCKSHASTVEGFCHFLCILTLSLDQVPYEILQYFFCQFVSLGLLQAYCLFKAHKIVYACVQILRDFPEDCLPRESCIVLIICDC